MGRLYLSKLHTSKIVRNSKRSELKKIISLNKVICIKNFTQKSILLVCDFLHVTLNGKKWVFNFSTHPIPQGLNHPRYDYYKALNM